MTNTNERSAEEEGEWEKEFDIRFVPPEEDYIPTTRTTSLKSFIRTLLSRTRKEAEAETWKAAVEAVADGQPTHDCSYVGCDDGCIQDKGGCDCRQQLITAAKDSGVNLEV